MSEVRSELPEQSFLFRENNTKEKKNPLPYVGKGFFVEVFEMNIPESIREKVPNGYVLKVYTFPKADEASVGGPFDSEDKLIKFLADDPEVSIDSDIWDNSEFASFLFDTEREVHIESTKQLALVLKKRYDNIKKLFGEQHVLDTQFFIAKDHENVPRLFEIQKKLSDDREQFQGNMNIDFLEEGCEQHFLEQIDDMLDKLEYLLATTKQVVPKIDRLVFLSKKFKNNSISYEEKREMGVIMIEQESIFALPDITASNLSILKTGDIKIFDTNSAVPRNSSQDKLDNQSIYMKNLALYYSQISTLIADMNNVKYVVQSKLKENQK
jgi:hypothetical protein